MAINKKLAAYLAERKKTDVYWVESAKLDFSMALEKQLKASGLTYSALAKKIGTSAAYITKVFRGDSNMTIESMVKLTRATGGSLNIYIASEAAAVSQWKKLPKQIWSSGEAKTIVGSGSTTVVPFVNYKFANDDYRTRDAA